jgi:predicted nucleic acid-binding protein
MHIVDVNIVFPLIVRSSLTGDVKELFDMDPEWTTEPYALIELSNILCTYERANIVTKKEAVETFRRAVDLLKPNLHSIADEVALETALRHKITAYDSRYIALAEKLDMRVITEDVRLRKAVPEFTISLRDALELLRK